MSSCDTLRSGKKEIEAQSEPQSRKLAKAEDGMTKTTDLTLGIGRIHELDLCLEPISNFESDRKQFYKGLRFSSLSYYCCHSHSATVCIKLKKNCHFLNIEVQEEELEDPR